MLKINYNICKKSKPQIWRFKARTNRRLEQHSIQGQTDKSFTILQL